MRKLETTGFVDYELVTKIKGSLNKTAFDISELEKLKNPTPEDIHKLIQEHL
jgi:hypothetical protein